MRLIEAIALGALGMAIAGGVGYWKGRSAGETARLTLKAQVDIANGNIDACAASLDDLRGQQAAELAKAERHAEATKLALEDVVRENLALADQLSDIEQRMALARQEPVCSEQLEAELCSAVPLL